MLFCLTVSLSAIAENTNSVSNPIALELDTDATLTIFPKGNSTFYKLNIPENGYLSCETNNVPKGIGVVSKFLLFDEFDGQKVLRNWNNANVPISLDKGEIIVQIGDDWNDGESKQEFSVKFHLTQQMDKFEPNNSMETAKPCELGKPISIAICPKGDHDWFSIEITKPGFLAIQTQATGMPEVLGVRQRIYKQVGDKLEKLGEGKTIKERASYISEPGKYFIEIYDDWDDKGSFQPFRIKLALLENNDLAEPNNNQSQAKDFPASGEAKISLFPIGDRDYFKLSSKTTEKIKVSNSSISGFTIKCSLFEIISDKEKKEIKMYVSLPHEFELLANKKYLLMINEDWDDNAKLETFTLFVKRIPATIKIAPSPIPSTTKIPNTKSKSAVISPSRSKKPQLVVVPNVVMQKVAVARKMILDVPLIPIIEIQSESVPLPQNIPNFEIKLDALLAVNANRSKNSRSDVQYVISQRPAAGVEIAKSSKVYLTTRLSPQQQVIVSPKPVIVAEPIKNEVKTFPVPKVVGKLKITANTILTKQGFKVRFTGKKIGFVSKQIPAANSHVEYGSVVTLKIGK